MAQFVVNQSASLPSKTVKVDLIDGAKANVIDSFGANMTIPLDFRVGKGALPRVGEFWTIVRDPGASTWVFYANLKTNLPIVAGDIPINSAVDQIVTTLAQSGFVVDNGDRVVDWSPWMAVDP